MALPLDETLGALTDLVRQGKVRYIGSSTAPAWKVMESIMVSELKHLARFVCEQPPYNLLDRRIENELIPMCQAHGLGILSWSPMAMGILAGRYADSSAYPSDSRATQRGGIYAERVTAAGIEVGNGFVELAREAGITPGATGRAVGQGSAGNHRAHYRAEEFGAVGANVACTRHDLAG